MMRAFARDVIAGLREPFWWIMACCALVLLRVLGVV